MTLTRVWAVRCGAARRAEARPREWTACASFAVIDQASAQLWRDLVLLVLGTVFGTGFAMLSDFLRARASRPA